MLSFVRHHEPWCTLNLFSGSLANKIQNDVTCKPGATQRKLQRASPIQREPRDIAVELTYLVLVSGDRNASRRNLRTGLITSEIPMPAIAVRRGRPL